MKHAEHPELVIVDYLCASWARWAGDQLADVGWPKSSICARILQWHELGVKPEHLSPGPKDTPAGAALVDAAVAKMPHRLQKVLIVEYFSGGSSEVKARRIGLSRLAFRTSLEGALWNLHGRLEGQFDESGVARRRETR